VRAVVRRLHGSDAAVSSPTFIFRQRYEGSPPVEHVDLYRIDDPIREPAELGLEEAFSADGIALIEWPERGGSWIPAERIDVAIDGVGDGPRRVRIVRPA
jgi:tRNA threonylcarbamoyl adenosine modification protein YjeE